MTLLYAAWGRLFVPGYNLVDGFLSSLSCLQRESTVSRMCCTGNRIHLIYFSEGVGSFASCPTTSFVIGIISKLTWTKFSMTCIPTTRVHWSKLWVGEALVVYDLCKFTENFKSKTNCILAQSSAKLNETLLGENISVEETLYHSEDKMHRCIVCKLVWNGTKYFISDDV